MRILVAVDGSEAAMNAVRLTAALFGDGRGTEVVCLHVVVPARLWLYDPAPMEPPVQMAEVLRAHDAEAERRGLAILDDATSLLSDVEATVRTVLVRGEPAAEILRAAEDGDFDVVVMGRRGMGRLPGVVFGSVSSKVVANAPCAVLVTR